VARRFTELGFQDKSGGKHGGYSVRKPQSAQHVDTAPLPLCSTVLRHCLKPVLSNQREQF
jgi:hypothetical protein